MRKLNRMNRLLVVCLACCLVLGQLLAAPPAQAAGISIFVDGTQLKADAAPYLQNGRVMVPFRALFEALGATVNWDGERRAVTGSRSGREVRLTIGSNTAYVNNAPQALDAPAAIVGGSTFVPLRFVGEALGATVQWDSANGAVRITLGGAAPATSSPSAAAPASKIITIKDSYGNVVMVPSPPKRIVVCNENVTKMICALGAVDSIVGRATSTKFPPATQSKMAVGTAFTPSAEKIISLKPDIFFGYGQYTDKTLIQQLRSHGIPVVMLDCYYVKSMTNEVTLLGKILGKEKEAADYNAFYLKYYNLVSDRVKNIPASKKPSLFLEHRNDYSTASIGSAPEDIMEAAGAKNLADELGIPFPKISSEWVLAKNPRVIISTSVSSSGYGASVGDLERKRNEIIRRPGWSNIDAVKTGRVYVMSLEIFTSPHSPIGVLYMAKCLYPDLFKDVDPASVNRELLSKFYGLQANGAWFYPELE